MHTTLLSEAKALEEELIAHRRHIHRNPEIGFDLPQTTAYVMKHLKEYGYEPKVVGKAGVTAVVGPCGGRTFLIRGDMDALPIKEETGLPFSSLNGKMHACGHDFHTSALLGAAKLLKAHEHELKGQVKLMFQPAEEIMDGANDMIAAGILENPHVDAAMALHVLHGDFGKACYTRDRACGSSDVFTITVKGVGGHGAAPHRNIDPINVACHIQLALQTINSREIDPNELIVLTICSIHSGSAANIMPSTAVMQGTIRTMDMGVKAFARQRLIDICEGVCKTLRAECQIDFIGGGIPPMYNNDELLTDTIRYIDDLLGEGTAQPIERMTGSEDFSALSVRVPSVLYWFGTGSTEEGYNYGVHDSRVTFNEEAMYRMSAIYAVSAIRWLEEHH
ncbi:MAG: M20 family metallopeptidase [Coprococcus sp.]